MILHDQYVLKPPSPQNAIDIMAGSWSSRFPDHYGLTAGHALLFQDRRLEWAISTLGGVKGMNILELGPLEAAHTWMLTNAGAATVTAIEANQRAFVKCLITKELLDIRKAKFLLGDFIAYMKDTADRYDLICASGVMYHMPDPVTFLRLLSNLADRIYIWTHYFDEAALRANGSLAAFGGPEIFRFEGRDLILRARSYRGAENQAIFCGGAYGDPRWMTRDDVIHSLRALCYANISIAHEQIDHPNGPCFSIVAQR